MGKKGSLSVSEPGFWVGSDGIVHNIGVGVIGIFAGPQAAQSLGGIFGNLEDAGIQALEEGQSQGQPSAQAGNGPGVPGQGPGQVPGVPGQTPPIVNPAPPIVAAQSNGTGRKT